MMPPYRPIIPPPFPTGNKEYDAEAMRKYRETQGRYAREDDVAMRWIVGIVTVGMLIFLGLLGLIIFEAVKTTVDAPEPNFFAGDVITMKIDGRKGMVRRGDCYKTCTYLVRFPAAALNTDTHFIAPDGPVVSGAYHDVWVYEFEVEPTA